MEVPEKKERNASIELLRILAMIMVIVLHNLAGSGALYEQSGVTYHLYWWIEALCICAVDVFVLISAYFLTTALFNLRNIFRILIITWIYSIPFSFLSAKLAGNTITASFLLKTLFPIVTKKYWFVNAYLAMYLLSPFINKLLRSLDKEQFSILLWIEIGLMILRPTLFPKAWAQDSTAGLSVFYFIALYCIAAWIRTYGSNWAIKPLYCILLYLLSSFFLVISKMLLMHLGISEDTASRYYSYDSVFVVFQALALFFSFLHIKPFKGRKAKIINSVARYSFAAYIIHYAMNNVLWRQILHLDRYVENPYIGPFIVLISSVFIFLSCCLLDSLRDFVTRPIIMNLKSKQIGLWWNKHITKCNNLLNKS